jgi:hypothetical protein
MGRSCFYTHSMPVRLLAAMTEEWTTVVGAAFLVTVSGPRTGAAEAAVAAIAELAPDPNVSLEAVVSAIPVGPDGVEAFALVHLDDAAALVAAGRIASGGIAMTAVVRGRAVVDVYSVGGSRRFSSSGVQPWLMAGFRDVIAVELGGPERSTAAVPHGQPEKSVRHTGVHRAGGLQWLLLPPGAPPEPPRSDSATPRAATDLEDATVHRHRAAQADAEDSTFDQTVRVRRRIEALEETMLRRPIGADAPGSPVRRQTALPSATVFEPSATADARMTPITAVPVAVEPDPPAQRPALAVRLPDGAVVPLESRPLIVGRRPAISARADRGALLVAVPSPNREVSASHLRIERSGDIVVITDLRSRNGTIVTPVGGVRRRLRPGESIVVASAAAVDVGDDMIIEITAG